LQTIAHPSMESRKEKTNVRTANVNFLLSMSRRSRHCVLLCENKSASELCLDFGRRLVELMVIQDDIGQITFNLWAVRWALTTVCTVRSGTTGAV
jgi:hypothetical protein